MSDKGAADDLEAGILLHEISGKLDALAGNLDSISGRLDAIQASLDSVTGADLAKTPPANLNLFQEES